MNMDARTDEKWAEILQYAREHATGEGMHKGYRWLQDAFEKYFNDHEERVEKGTMPSFGGASFSDHNRTVFAAQIARSLRYNENGYEGARLTDEQFDKLTDTLQWIKEHPNNLNYRIIEYDKEETTIKRNWLRVANSKPADEAEGKCFLLSFQRGKGTHFLREIQIYNHNFNIKRRKKV